MIHKRQCGVLTHFYNVRKYFVHIKIYSVSMLINRCIWMTLMIPMTSPNKAAYLSARRATISWHTYHMPAHKPLSRPALWRHWGIPVILKALQILICLRCWLQMAYAYIEIRASARCVQCFVLLWYSVQIRTSQSNIPAPPIPMDPHVCASFNICTTYLLDIYLELDRLYTDSARGYNEFYSLYVFRQRTLSYTFIHCMLSSAYTHTSEYVHLQCFFVCSVG